MVSIKKELLLGLLIPLVFTIGVLAYFYFIPSGTQGLNSFISYSSSLATILMVLVVIVTTSLQINEMQSTKLLQTQPFPAITPLDKSFIEELQFFTDPTKEHKVIVLENRLVFFFNVENIGSAPIVSIDIIPKLYFCNEENKKQATSPVWARINSLKPNEAKEKHIMFVNETGVKPTMVDCMLRNFIASTGKCRRETKCSVEILILYKNVLGANFKQRNVFDIFVYEEDLEIIKSCVKLSETAPIDLNEKISTANSLIENNPSKADAMLDEMNNYLLKDKGCTKIFFDAVSNNKEFSVNPISENEYKKLLKNQSYAHVTEAHKPITNELSP